jgi:hypothetical protein
MSEISYRVSRPRPDRLQVEATIEPDASPTVLVMRDRYGPAHGFASGLSNVAVRGADARAAIQPGKVLVAASDPYVLTYDCSLPEYSDVGSLLRGFHRRETLFSPGMAIFHSLHGGRGQYRVAFEPDGTSLYSPMGLPDTNGNAAEHVPPEATASCCKSAGRRGECLPNPASRRGPMEWTRAYRRPGALERAYFAWGDFIVQAAGATRFIHERDFPFALDELLALWPRLSGAISDVLGSDWTSNLVFFLFASAEHPAGRPGAGFSFPGGALVSVSANDEALASPQTLWLLLHEWSHQWLGEGIVRARTADDWFFEGFANFVAHAALQRCGLLARSSLARLLIESRRAILRGRMSGDPALAHHGFLCAMRWNQLLSHQGSSVGQVLSALVGSHRGRTLQGEALLAALGDASPRRDVPDFLARLATPAGSRMDSTCSST